MAKRARARQASSAAPKSVSGVCAVQPAYFSVKDVLSHALGALDSIAQEAQVYLDDHDATATVNDNGDATAAGMPIASSATAHAHKRRRPDRGPDTTTVASEANSTDDDKHAAPLRQREQAQRQQAFSVKAQVYASMSSPHYHTLTTAVVGFGAQLLPSMNTITHRLSFMLLHTPLLSSVSCWELAALLCGYYRAGASSLLRELLESLLNPSIHRSSSSSSSSRSYVNGHMSNRIDAHDGDNNTVLSTNASSMLTSWMGSRVFLFGAAIVYPTELLGMVQDGLTGHVSRATAAPSQHEQHREDQQRDDEEARQASLEWDVKLARVARKLAALRSMLHTAGPYMPSALLQQTGLRLAYEVIEQGMLSTTGMPLEQNHDNSNNNYTDHGRDVCNRDIKKANIDATSTTHSNGGPCTTSSSSREGVHTVPAAPWRVPVELYAECIRLLNTMLMLCQPAPASLIMCATRLVRQLTAQLHRGQVLSFAVAGERDNIRAGNRAVTVAAAASSTATKNDLTQPDDGNITTTTTTQFGMRGMMGAKNRSGVLDMTASMSASPDAKSNAANGGTHGSASLLDNRPASASAALSSAKDGGALSVSAAWYRVSGEVMTATAELSLTLRLLHHPQRVLAYTPTHTVVEQVQRRVVVLTETAEEKPMTMTNAYVALDGMSAASCRDDAHTEKNSNAHANSNKDNNATTCTDSSSADVTRGTSSSGAVYEAVRATNSSETVAESHSIHPTVNDDSAVVRSTDEHRAQQQQQHSVSSALPCEENAVMTTAGKSIVLAAAPANAVLATATKSGGVQEATEEEDDDIPSIVMDD